MARRLRRQLRGRRPLLLALPPALLASTRACLSAFASPARRAAKLEGRDGAGLAKLESPEEGVSVRGEERKVRSAIESILLDQEGLRQSTPLLSGRTVFAACSTAGLAGLAAVASTLPAWGAVLLPALTSGIFIYSSVAESSSARSKGLARYSSAAALSLATQQESVLALAEEKKAFLPFGAGLTAIFACGCVTLKILEEEEVGVPVIQGILVAGVTGDDLFLAVVLVLTVAGAVLTSDRCVCMQAALTLAPEARRRSDFDSEWEARQLPLVAQDPDPALRAVAFVLTIVACVLPFLVTSAVGGGATTIEQAAVIISATAAAWSAWVLLVAEKDFADAERRIAIQAKQAALAELFNAQAGAESAVMPVTTAVSGAALGGATLAVEFSLPAAMLLAGPAVVSSVMSSIGAIMTRYEATASFLEFQRSKKGLGNQRPSDSISSSLRELNRLQAEFGFDKFAEEVRERLRKLPRGRSEEFKWLPRQDRRQVHLVAAELGMESQSFGNMQQRVVLVTNSGSRAEAVQAAPSQDVWDSLSAELRAAFARGLPEESRPIVLLAAAGTLGSLAAPLVATRVVAELLVPLATSGVGLATVWQETAGKKVVAIAKQRSANLMQLQSEAEVQIGRATMSYAALPTAFAVMNLAMTSAIVGLAHGSARWVPIAVELALPLACVTAAVTWQRCKKVERYVASALRLIGIRKVPAQWVSQRKRWWLLPIVVAMLVPCHLSQRLALTCSMFVAEVGVLMGHSARQIAWGKYYTARCGVSSASADAWSQQAQDAVRRLPVESAVAVAGTLLSTAVVAFSLPLSLAFPVLGFSVFVRAVQFRAEAQENASRADDVCNAPRQSSRPWPWSSGPMKAPVEDAMEGAEVQTVGWASLLAPQMQRTRRRLGSQSFSFRRAYASFLGLWDVRPPEREYDLNPAEMAVKNIQADLDEARISMRSNERNWLRMLSTVAAIATGAILIPFLLPEIATEVALPVAGTALTVLTASTESDAGRRVAKAKVRAAELCAAIQRTEELLATATFPRAYLVGAAGCACGIAAVLLVLEHPLSSSPWMLSMQHVFQILLTIAQISLSAWCVRPLREVLHITDNSRRITADMFRESPSLRLPPRRRRIIDPWAILAALLPTSLAFFPSSRSIAQRTVASGAAAGFLLAMVLLIAEAATARAELTLARRARAFALTDAFSNEAEQESALLPLASAATIAFSGFITFGTELNPYAASAFVLLQVATWVLASRKAVAAKFDVTAAMQVDSVAKYGALQLGNGGGASAGPAGGGSQQ